VTACPECGLDPRTMGPRDAIAALRSFPPRGRGAVALAGDEDEARDLLRRRPPAGGGSALERAGLAQALLAGWRERIRQALVSERPSVPTPEAEAVTAEDAGTALDGLTREAEDLAGALDAVAAQDWDRRAFLDGQEVSVLGMAQEAAHAGAHHLRAVERLLREVKGLPT
jgi:hypothetical protein